MISAKYGCPIEHLDLVSSILGKPHHMFDVMHRDKNIYLIYAKRDVDASGLRGPIVDIEAKAIVSPSAPEKFDVVRDELQVDEHGIMSFCDVDKKLHVLKKYELYYGFQGTIVRVFKRDGKVFWATGKTLSFHDKSWGNHDITFGTMWKDLKGPSEEDLFAGETSSHVYQFLMVHKNLQVASRFTIMNPGFIILMSKDKTCWDVADNCPYNVEAPSGYLDHLVMPWGHEIREPFVSANTTCSVQQANEYLTCGLRKDLPIHKDPRLTNGEFIFAKCLETGNSYQINSVAYQYRSSLRIKPYLYDAFHEHFNSVLMSEKNKKDVRQAKNPNACRKVDDMLTEEVFLRTYIPLKDSVYPIIEPEVMDNVKWPMKNVSFAIKLIFKCFLYSLPPVLQEDYKYVHQEYLNTKKYVCDKIHQIARNSRFHHDNGRIRTIIMQARKYVEMGRDSNNPDALKKSIEYLVDYELVFSLLAISKYLSDNFFEDEYKGEGSMEIKFIDKGRSYIPGYMPKKHNHAIKPKYTNGPIKKFPQAKKEVEYKEDPTPSEITIVNPV